MGLAPATDLSPKLAGIPLSDIPVPNGREEEWRFTPLKRLDGLHEMNSVSNYLDFSIQAGEYQLTKQTAKDFLAADRLSAISAQLSPETYALNLPGDTSSDEPIVINVQCQAAKSIGRLQLNVGKNSKFTVIVQQVSELSQNIALGVELAENATLQLITVQDAGTAGVLVGQHAFDLKAGSNLDYRTATLGGGLVRMNTTVKFLGEGAAAKLAGAFFTTDGQHHEHRLFVGHELPNCTSDVVYKGAIQGDNSHSVWIGDVLIDAEAKGTKTYELNRNLLLTSGARADSVPNLEIETGEILGAGHASATGRFDEEQLFYLMSRGIPESQAKRLVVRGFLGEVIDAIAVDSLRTKLWHRIDSLLGADDKLFAEVADA